ncbi:MAG: glycosyltransferase [Microcoleaceae cyanobacterium]
MTHFGILCLGATGHLNTMFPLGHELQHRGHHVTIFSISNAQSKVELAGFDFCDIYFQPGKASRQYSQVEKVGILTNVLKIKRTLNEFAQQAETRLQRAPVAIREQSVTVFLTIYST